LSYKNFTLSFLINSIQGGNGYYLDDNNRLLEATSAFDYAQRQNGPAIRENWTPDNGVTDAPAVYNYPRVASGNYQDRSFVRLQDISLRYVFQKSLVDRLHLENMQIYLSGKNLYTWTKWEGFDPELVGDDFQYDMMMRDITLGIRLGF
jgi:TonB-dependent starch-binding outer membrane protein SusC